MLFGVRVHVEVLRISNLSLIEINFHKKWCTLLQRYSIFSIINAFLYVLRKENLINRRSKLQKLSSRNTYAIVIEQFFSNSKSRRSIVATKTHES